MGDSITASITRSDCETITALPPGAVTIGNQGSLTIQPEGLTMKGTGDIIEYTEIQKQWDTAIRPGIGYWDQQKYAQTQFDWGASPLVQLMANKKKETEGMKIYVAAAYDIDEDGHPVSGVSNDYIVIVAKNDKRARDLAVAHYIKTGSEIDKMDEKGGWGLCIE